MEAIIEKFKTKGKSYLWKYKENFRNYPGWVEYFGHDRLLELKSAIVGIPQGEGDFSIGDEEEETNDNILYFWGNK